MSSFRSDRSGRPRTSVFFFFNDTATTEIYTLSLHDALPIYRHRAADRGGMGGPLSTAAHLGRRRLLPQPRRSLADRKSTRLNSSHGYISYAVFCLEKKNSSLGRKF